MTFQQLKTDLMDRLNLSSAEANVRIGRAINRKYRLVTSSIGLQLSRRAEIFQVASLGLSTMTFTNTEKVINVVNRATTPYKLLHEVTIEELRDGHQPYSQGDTPTHYAVIAQTSDAVTIEFNRIAQTTFTLYASVHQAVSDLSGTNEPAFPESFHDVLIEGVMSDELRKMEKPQLASIAEKEYTRFLSDLRMWIAKNSYRDIHQGKTSEASRTSSGSGGSSSGGASGASSYTQTGLITFDRDPLTPFVVTPSSAVVINLDADKLDGLHAASFLQPAVDSNITGNVTFARGASQPFTIAGASPVVTNLDADKLDGFHETSFAKLADNETITGVWSFSTPPTGLPTGVSIIEVQVFS